MQIKTVGSLAFVLLLAATLALSAELPVPFYPANVTKTKKYSDGAVILKTKDSVDTVCAWYRKNLKNGQGEHTTEDGAHIFYTVSGATVDVEPGPSFNPGTTISLSWDAKKFGAYTGP